MGRQNGLSQSTISVRPVVAKMVVCVTLLVGCGTNAALDVDAGAAAPTAPGAAGADAGEGSAASAGKGGTTPSRRALSVAVGLGHACAVLEDHTVKCWGDNTPAPIASLRALAISTEGTVTCAIVEDGSVTCWNGVSFGPQLPAGQRAVGIAANVSGGCAILDAGGGLCWAGPGSDPGPDGKLFQWMFDLPVGAPKIRQICEGCAGLLYEDGTVSWPTFEGYEAPHLLDGHAVTSLAGDQSGTGNWCATLADGGAFCNGITTPPSSAVMTALSIDDYDGQDNVCALDASGKVSCWGVTAGCSTNPSQSYWCVSAPNSDGSHDVALGQPALSIVAGSSPFPVMCALLADGSIKCWGGADIDSVFGLDPVLRQSVSIIDTPNGSTYGPWHAIDLESLP